MNRTKTIYFLSAFVLIIGCYALNLSYSLFTQTITPNNLVDSSVPVINASLETSTFTIPTKEELAYSEALGSEEEWSIDFNLNDGDVYFTYGNDYTFDEETGTFSLIDTYHSASDSSGQISYLKDRYLALIPGGINEEKQATTGLTEIYKVTSVNQVWSGSDIETYTINFIPIRSTSSSNYTGSKLIKLKIINSGTADIQYGISVTDTKGATIELVEGYNITGTLKASETEGETTSTEVWVYVTNPTSSDITDITFNLTTKYNTVSFNEEEFIANTNIDTNSTVKLLNSAIIARAKDDSITNKTIYSETLSTTPGRAISGDSESLLLESEDDYTKTTGKNSYYFRGNVRDNFLNYSGMCWRIVRIQGNGTIKLVLADEEYECGADTGYNFDNLDSAFIGDTATQAFKGYDYSVIKYSSSPAKTALESWANGGDYQYTDINTGNTATGTFEKHLDTSNVEIAEWCNDTSVSEWESGMEGVPGSYSGYTRLITTTNASPSLKCDFTGLGSTTVTKVASFVGMLTADEIAFAGAASSIDNINYYLYTNATGNYWTMTPSTNFDHEAQPNLWYVNGGTLKYDSLYANWNNDGTEPYALRPSIVLKNDVIFNSGTGVYDDPYTIK